MAMGRILRHALGALIAGAAVVLAPVAKAETVTVGLVGAASSNLWPVYIGLNKGYFAAEDLKLDLVFIQSSAALSQQLAAGSLDVGMSTGLVDPIRAIEKGAPSRSCASRCRRRPMRCSPSPRSSGWTDLKGKTISLGGPKDITRIYRRAHAGAERRQARRVRHGVRRRDLGALLGAARRARSMPRSCCRRSISMPESAGFTNLGLTIDYAKDLPFAGAVVGRAWAGSHKSTLAEGARGPQQEHGLVLRSAEPRRSGQDHGGRRASSRRTTSTAPTTSCTRASSSRPPAGSPGPSWARWSRRSKTSATFEGSTDVERFVLPGDHPVDGLSWSRRSVSGAEAIEVQGAAQPQRHRRLPRSLFRRPALGSGRAAAVGAGEPLPRRQYAVSRRALADLHGDLWRSPGAARCGGTCRSARSSSRSAT